MTPTQRTLAALKKQSVICQVVEKWNPYGGARKPDGTAVGNRVDLFGIIDIISLDNGIVGIQATSGSNIWSRVNKAMMEPRLLEWMKSGGRFEVWGWRKLARTKRWEVRKVRATYHSEWPWYLTFEEIEAPKVVKRQEKARRKSERKLFK